MLKQVRFYLPLFLFVFFALVFYFALNNEDKEEIPSPLIGKALPSFSLPSLLSNETYNENSFLGQPYLLNVWGSWCPSCYAEHEYLTALAKSGVMLVGLNYKDEAVDAKAFLTNLGNPYAFIIADKKGSLALDLGVYGAPETYLIGHDGSILAKRVGVVDEGVWKKVFENLWQIDLSMSKSQQKGSGL